MINEEEDNNYILAEINVKKEDLNKKIRIIYSFEESIRNKEIYFIEEKDYDKYENENEIKDNCRIKINIILLILIIIMNLKKLGNIQLNIYFLTILLKQILCLVDVNIC